MNELSDDAAWGMFEELEAKANATQRVATPKIIGANSTYDQTRMTAP